MMDEWASLSKICRAEWSVYSSCGLNSSVMNSRLNIATTTSCSTARNKRKRTRVGGERTKSAFPLNALEKNQGRSQRNRTCLFYGIYPWSPSPAQSFAPATAADGNGGGEDNTFKDNKLPAGGARWSKKTQTARHGRRGKAPGRGCRASRCPGSGSGSASRAATWRLVAATAGRWSAPLLLFSFVFPVRCPGAPSPPPPPPSPFSVGR
eukprot:SAG22_NODE_3265_length_1821_cov_3.116144_2_plen_208_part_00